MIAFGRYAERATDCNPAQPGAPAARVVLLV